jgi:hypothetical protein
MEKEIDNIQGMDDETRERMFQTLYYYKCERWRVKGVIKKLEDARAVRTEAIGRLGLPTDLVQMIGSF